MEKHELVILGGSLFVIGAIGMIFEFLPRNTLTVMTVLAIIFVGAGAGFNKKAHSINAG